MAEKKWDGTTYGTGRMHRWLIALLRRVDVRVLYVFAYVFVVPPCLFRPGFKPMYHFFRRRWGFSVLKAFRYTYLNHCQFARVVIDRFAMYAGKKFHIEIEGYEHFLRLSEQSEGFVQLSSHVGNYEIAGYSLIAERKPFHALVFMGEKTSVMDNRKRMFAHSGIDMIPVSSDMSHLFEINAALDRGETVSIPADRIWGSSKSVTQTLLGAEAQFPSGPFQVVAMRGLQVLAVHVMKISARGYKIYVTPIDYDRTAPRRQQVDELSRSYVNELERMVRLYPTQWYNYFEFWGEVEGTRRAVTANKDKQ